MNQFLGSIVLWPIEEIVNRLISKDPHVSAGLLPFRHKLIEIVCTAPALTLTLRFDEEVIRLGAVDSATLQLPADARISGTAADLLQLLMRSGRRALANPAISIAGDAQLVQELYNTVHELDLDWEDYLTPFLGEVVTNELGNISSKARDWSQQAGAAMRRNVDEYLQEEARLVPDRERVEGFGNSLDQLRLDIDRVAARADRLRQRMNDLSH